MNKPLTVKDLLKICEQETAKGNGNKVIMISDDDEGNGYHYLWYAFTEAEGLVDEYTICEDIAKAKDTIVLG